MANPLTEILTLVVNKQDHKKLLEICYNPDLNGYEVNCNAFVLSFIFHLCFIVLVYLAKNTSNVFFSMRSNTSSLHFFLFPE